MSKFQIIVLSIFILFLIAGVIAFATFKSSGSDNELPPITIWGTFPADVFDQYVGEVNNSLSSQIKVTYVFKRPEAFSTDFISALARGQGPDAILIPADTLLPHQDKLVLIPYSVFPRRSFMDSYIQEGNIYLFGDGFLGLPFTVDPLVMYWNRDIFDAAGIATYPQYWDEFAALNKKLTIKDQKGNIRKTAVAMGDFGNVINARELLGTLVMQAGNAITTLDSEGDIVSTFRPSTSASAASSVEFFTRAVDPASESYSWNRTFPDSKTSFLSGILATYFGFASELPDLRLKNPNINFDAALIPQLRSGGQKATYGRMYGFSVVRTSPNTSAAFQVISTLTAPQFLTALSDKLYLPSVRREVISQGSQDPYITIFNEAALVARTWLDADPVKSRALFKNMTDSIVSGERSVSQALQDTADQYDVILREAIAQ